MRKSVIIGIAGGTASGKTSLAKRLAKTFPPFDDAQSAHHSVPARLGTADARTLEPLYGGFSAKRD